VNAKPRVRYPFSIVRERIRDHDGPVQEFAFGRLPQNTPAAILEALRAHSERALVRASPAELEGLTARAADWFSRTFGIRPEPETILPCPGGRMAMSALASTLLAPGDGVVVTEPTYPAFARLARQVHADVLEVPLDPARGFDPDLSSLCDRPSGSIRLVALNYPNNPTAVVPSDNALTELRRVAGDEAIWFNDATYGPLTHDIPPYSMIEAAGPRLLLELHSLAKFFSLGPLAVAFLLGDGEAVTQVRDYSEFAWTPMSALQVEIARICLEDDGHVAAFASATRDRIRRLRETVVKLGFEPYEGQAGMYLLCRAPGSVGGRPVDGALEAAGMLLDRFGIAVMPWETPPNRYVRFSGMYTPDELGALDRLAESGPIVSS
jgi:aspartate/methionine/tyrosine aminotransferase